MSTSLQKIFIKRFNFMAILSALLLGLFLVKAERVILLNDLNNKGEALARILASVTLDAAMVHDYATMERYVEDIVVDQAITSIEIRRADNEILASSGTITDTTDSLIVSKPITLGTTVFGEIQIGLSTARVDAISRNLLFATLSAIVLFHLLGMIMGNLALKKAVTEPLFKLNQAIEKFRQGNLDETINISEPEEFAAIGNSFNSMAETIHRNFQDIKKQQEKLQLEQNKLATIVGSVADGLFVTDNSGVIFAYNQSATEITGFTEKEAIGQKCSDLFRSNLCKEACALNHAGEKVRNKETTLKSKDDRVLDVAVSSAMLYDAEGEAVGGVQTFRDITADKKRQEMYCHTEKLAAIGQLAAGVAHEINNPLSNILGYARSIKADSSVDEIAKRVEVIVEQTRKCSGIVQGLLNFSRNSGAQPCECVLNPLVEKTIDMLRYEAETKGVQVHFSPAANYSVYADPQKIEQVFLNLLLNSLQSVPGNGSNIWIQLGSAGKSVYFSLADDGPGIKPEIMPKVFDPFFSTKPVGQGTGLGLSICAGIIAESKGSIDVENRDGGGVVFTVLLPAPDISPVESV